MSVPFMQGQLLSKAAMPITLGEATDWTSATINTWLTIRNNTTPKYLEWNYTPAEDGIALCIATLGWHHSVADALCYIRIYENLTGAVIAEEPSWSISTSYDSSAIVIGVHELTANTACEFKAQFYLITAGTITLARDVNRTKLLIVPYANP